MKRLRILGLALLAIFALGAIISATASALPTLLNSKGELILVTEKYTGESKTTEFWKLNGNNVACKKSTAEGQFEPDSVLGLFHIKFNECVGKVGGITAPCLGEGDKVAEEVLVLGTAHLVYDTLKPTLGAAVLFLIPQFHFTCTNIIKVLILVKGEVLCLIKPIETLTKHFEIICVQGIPKNGDPNETQYWNDKGGEVQTTVGLLGSESTEKAGEKFEMAAELGVGLILTELEVIIMA